MNLSQIIEPIGTLLQIILDQYFITSFCVTIVSETPLDLKIPINFMYIKPRAENFADILLDASDKGCSDYVVLMNEAEIFMAAFEKVNHLGLVRRSDRKIVIAPTANGNNILNILSLKESEFVPNILVVAPEELIDGCQVYDLVSHNYVGLDVESNLPLYLDRWDSCTEKFEKKTHLFPHDMSNMMGKTLKVACFTYKPYVLLDLDITKSATGRDGIEMRMIEEFCSWVNCSIEIVRDDVNEWGDIYENNTGVGILGNIVEDRADVGISALYSWYEIYRVLDFSAAGVRTAISCIAPAPGLLDSWETPLLPFTWEMWLCIIFTYIYASLALSIANGWSIDRVFLTTFGMMITQSQFDAGTSWRIRSVTGWLLITGLILDNAYGGGLASVFTVPKYEPSIDTVQDLIDHKMEWGATHDAWIFSLTLSSEEKVEQLISKFRVYSAEELQRKSFERSMAFSIEKLPAGYFAIGEYITKDVVPSYQLMLEDFYYEQCVVMLRKSSPYTAKISDFVGRLHDSGLMLAWETQVAINNLDFKVQLEVKLSRSIRDVENVQSLSFRNVLGIFFIYIAGVTVAILAFLAEKLTNNKKQKRANMVIKFT